MQEIHGRIDFLSDIADDLVEGHGQKRRCLTNQAVVDQLFERVDADAEMVFDEIGGDFLVAFSGLTPSETIG